MELINPRTFLIVANLLGLLCALVLWVQAKSFPADIGGLRDWARAVVLMGCASGLASLRGILPDAFAIVLAAALLLFGELLLVIGLLRYTGRTPQWRPALDAVLGLTLLVGWLTWGSPSYPGRIFIMSLAHIAFFSLGAWLARQAKPAGFGSRLLAATFVLGVIIAVLRIATLSTDFSDADEVFDRDLIQQVYLGAFSLGILGLSIGFILIANERLRDELEYLATRDPMTGAFNRRAFFARAEVEWARAARSKRPLAAIASDIDFFKKVNDTYGHHVGDLVIKDFARRSGSMLRLPDILARFGGEEFVILLPETGLKDACRVAERIRQEIEKRKDKALPPYTVSLGVAVASGDENDPADLEALLAQADAALYKAKQGGRNRVER
ncbi:MAG: GGDEF domain-containing protein [Rhodocyclales bacterium]|nr:GGDEF domain-containing protein [Rhodocyclales bacterium]